MVGDTKANLNFEKLELVKRVFHEASHSPRFMWNTDESKRRISPLRCVYGMWVQIEQNLWNFRYATNVYGPMCFIKAWLCRIIRTVFNTFSREQYFIRWQMRFFSLFTAEQSWHRAEVARSSLYEKCFGKGAITVPQIVRSRSPGNSQDVLGRYIRV